MSILVAEKVYRYPWRWRFVSSAIGSILVLLSLLSAGREILRGVAAFIEPVALFLRRVPWLRLLLDWLGPLPARLELWAPEALITCLVAALGLMAALLVFNAFPLIRVSNRGMLVAFAGGWLPVAWEDVERIDVTGDEAGLRFVLLLVPRRKAKRLTGWHRAYGLLYGTTVRPALLISSAIQDFDQLLSTILQENARAIRGIEGQSPAVVDEQRRSWLFGVFTRGMGAAESLPESAALPPMDGPAVIAAAPRFSIVRLIAWGTALVFLVAGLFYYRSFWERALALLVPGLRAQPSLLWVSEIPVYSAIFASYRDVSVPFFGIAGRPDLPAPVWLVIAAHLMLLLVIGFCLALTLTFPFNVTANRDEIVLRYFFRRYRITIPWAQISAFKVVDLGFGRSLALAQSPRLPWLCGLTGLIVEGRWRPTVVLIDSLTSWSELLERCAERLSHLPELADGARFQPAAFMPNLQLIGQPVATTGALAFELANQPQRALLWQAGRAMMLTAAPLGLMFALPLLIDGDRWPSLTMALSGLGFWLAGLIEWPLVVLIALILHGSLDSEHEQIRTFAFYPLVQRSRLLPMILALISLIGNLPWLAVICWLIALALAYWATAALWVELYEWDGAQAVLGGLLPVFWQMLVMVGFFLLR